MAGPTVAAPVLTAGRYGRRPAPEITFWISLAILAIVILVSLLANLIAPYDPIAQDLGSTFAPPSAAHWLGTDDLGRDVLSRMIFGTRVSMLVSLLAVGIALAIGLPIGLLAGYLGGWVDTALMRVIDTLLAFPAIILAIGITATLGPSILNAMLAVGIILSPSIARLIRAQVLSVKEETYIEAARSFGARGFVRMVLVHVIPNSIQPVLVQTSILMGSALIAEATLSFLGLGVQPPDPSWGSILSRAYTFNALAPFQIIVPGLAIAICVFAFTTLGDKAQERLDPRRRR